MAISDKAKVQNNESSNPVRRWVDPYRTIAAAVAMALGAAAVVAAVYFLIANPTATDIPLFVVLILLGAISLVAGGVLRRGSLSAQKQALWILLVFWLLAALAGALQVFAALIWDGGCLLPEAKAWAYLLAAAEVIFGGFMAMLLFRATAPATRDRYGANVTISVAVVVAVVIVLNMLSFAAPYEKDFETLGRYGLSERSQRICREVEAPLHIWAVYTDAKMAAETQEQRLARDQARKRLDRVMELLEEMHRCNPRIVVRDASGDAARANLMATLRKLQQGKTGRQEELLRKVRQTIPTILREIESLQQRWRQLPRDSYLGLWDLGGKMEDIFKAQAENLETADRTVAQEINASPLPDYVKLLKDLSQELRSCKQAIQVNTKTIQRLGGLPEAIRKNAAGVRKNLDACVRDVAAVDNIVRRGGKQGPKDPAEALRQISAALGKAGTTVRETATALDNIAGKDAQDVHLVSISRAWQIEIPSELGRIRTTRSRLFDALAQDLRNLRTRTAVQRSDANESAQRRFVVDLRKPIARLLTMMREHRSAVEEGLDQLTTVDAESNALLAEVQAGGAFAPVQEILDPLLKECDELKTPQNDTLPPDLSGKNIIVLRTGEKVEVVTFDDTFPQRSVGGGEAWGDSSDRRFFNGDAVLASRILGMTRSKPFGRVLIAYLEPKLPPSLRMRIRLPQGDIPPSQLTELTKRLKEANFQVQNWNLDAPMPRPASAEDLTVEAATQPTTTPARDDRIPTILLVVPPAPPMPPLGPGQPPMPGFGPEHLQKIRDAVDDGASAMFLTCYLRPQMMGFGMPVPQRYAFAEYLRNVWGLEAKTGHLLIEGIPSEEYPGKYQINREKTTFMPVNSFTSQPIGKPLQGRRMIWSASCPITNTPEAPEGVVCTPVLVVPKTRTNVWATGNIQRLVEEIETSRKSFVTPQYDKGDLQVPLTLATAATRAGNLTQGIAPSRLVLLGVGFSLTDMFLSTPVQQQSKQGGYELVPPPRDNLDLLVNAAYWLVGKESYIAAGPVTVEPVRAMEPETQITLWVLCVLVLPAAVIVAGLMVMAARRKS